MIVQVLNRSELYKMAVQPFPPLMAVISICDSDAPAVRLKNLPDYLLRLVFDDMCSLYGYEEDEGTKFVSFSERQAEEIARFIARHKDEVGTIICQCEMGQSHSAAVAAAISEWLNGDGIRFFTDDRYSPNLYVFRTLYKALSSGECL